VAAIPLWFRGVIGGRARRGGPTGDFTLAFPSLSGSDPAPKLWLWGEPPARAAALRLFVRDVGLRGELEVAASRSVPHPTRLETRTKESRVRASSRDLNRPAGAMKVKGGFSFLSWDPRISHPGRTNGPSDVVLGGAEQERVLWDPKDGELCLGRTKPEETLVEVRSDSDVQIDRQTWV
jgi:hypothetical protein